MVVEFGEGDTWLLSRAEKSRITALLQRNRRVPELLANLKNDETLIFLVPCFLRLAQQSPRMALNTILLGMLASNLIKGSTSNSSKGSTSSNKRLRADQVEMKVLRLS
jgi:hypothetical protein